MNSSLFLVLPDYWTAARDQSIHQEYFQYLLAQENGQGLPAASDGLTSLMQPRTDPDGVFDTENRNDSTPPPSYQESDVRPPVYRHNTSTPQSSTVQPVTHTELSWGHGRGHNSQYEQLLAAISRNTADGRPMTRDEAQTALVQRLGELLGVRQ